ncbi:MAG: hypothetical protein QI199_04370 [Candidatus Korarchaeota archaeon]|nr:hypothetical protein [Candidatus Korarchaeota archaeon]
MRRRALSPLVATAILISAAVIGGMMLYNYFNTAMGSVNKVDSLIADFNAMNVGSTTILHYEFWNTGTQPANITGIVVVDSSGNTTSIPVTPIVVRGGDKASGTLVLGTPLSPGEAYVVYAEYSAGGRVSTTNPVQITVTP